MSNYMGVKLQHIERLGTFKKLPGCDESLESVNTDDIINGVIFHQHVRDWNLCSLLHPHDLEEVHVVH